MRRDSNWREQLGAMDQVKRLMGQEEYEQARDLLLRLLPQRRGKASAYLFWSLAVAFDNLEEFEMAMTTVEEAVARDPLATPIHRSFDLIVDHIRASLGSAARAASDPSTPRLYGMLVASGQADVGCHLAMARFHLEAGDVAAARRLLDATTTLGPVHRDAWQATLDFAVRTGDAGLAEACRIELASLGDDVGVAFAILGRARG